MAGNLVHQLRQEVAALLGVSPQRICLPVSATFGLNQAIHGVVTTGTHVITTAADHNATLRPLHYLQEKGRIQLSVVPCDGQGWAVSYTHLTLPTILLV